MLFFSLDVYHYTLLARANVTPLITIADVKRAERDEASAAPFAFHHALLLCPISPKHHWPFAHVLISRAIALAFPPLMNVFAVICAQIILLLALALVLAQIILLLALARIISRATALAFAPLINVCALICAQIIVPLATAQIILALVLAELILLLALVLAQIILLPALAHSIFALVVAQIILLRALALAPVLAQTILLLAFALVLAPALCINVVSSTRAFMRRPEIAWSCPPVECAAVPTPTQPAFRSSI